MACGFGPQDCLNMTPATLLWWARRAAEKGRL